MAMSATTLGMAISNAVESKVAEEGVKPSDIWTAVAEEIIKHITTNAVVSVNVNTTVNTVVTTSAGAGTGTGAGVGTGTGTIA